MPGDIDHRLSNKIFLVEFVPEFLHRLHRDPVLGKRRSRCLFLIRDAVFAILRVLKTSTQRLLGVCVELGQQRGTPAIPQFRIGRADICDRHGVEVVQMELVTHYRGELVNHFGV